jgi:His/Glu/Gln/Arg/opine family amino acid ABC transporter permease subunit
MNIDLESIIYIIKGVGITLKYSLISVLLGIFIGLLLTMSSYSNIFWQTFRRFYVSIFRGTPLLIQLSIVYYATPGLTGYKISAFEAGVIAFSLNSGAYISEVIRAGISSIDKGQFEAAYTLGIPKSQMMRDIIMPQAMRNILPALFNEIIDMVKESALVSVIGEADLMRRAQTVAGEKYTFFEPLLVAAICYYIMISLLSFCGKLIENKLKKDKI